MGTPPPPFNWPCTVRPRRHRGGATPPWRRAHEKKMRMGGGKGGGTRADVQGNDRAGRGRGTVGGGLLRARRVRVAGAGGGPHARAMHTGTHWCSPPPPPHPPTTPHAPSPQPPTRSRQRVASYRSRSQPMGPISTPTRPARAGTAAMAATSAASPCTHGRRTPSRRHSPRGYAATTLPSGKLRGRAQGVGAGTRGACRNERAARTPRRGLRGRGPPSDGHGRHTPPPRPSQWPTTQSSLSRGEGGVGPGTGGEEEGKRPRWVGGTERGWLQVGWLLVFRSHVSRP